MKRIILIIIILVAVVVGWLWILPMFNKNNEAVQVPSDWKSYSSNFAGFSINYDPTLTLKEDTKTDIRFYKWGPTQRGQTEMYDGIILSIRKVVVTDGGKVYIDSQIEQFKNVGTITKSLREGKLNGIVVKEFSASSLGDFNVIFVPVNDQTLLEISYMIPDPTGAGFQGVIDTMLSTFRIVK